MIHKSFTKKDLLDLIDAYEMEIEDPKSLSKKDLQIQLDDYLQLSDIPFSTEYDFNCSGDLLEYLKNEKPNIDLNYKEKGEMITLAKRILKYTRNGYSIAFTDFLDIEGIYQKGILLANHGDIPTCRRAVDELNKDPKIRNKIEVKISSKVKKEIEKKKINKESLNNRYKCEKKYVCISFD
ncbi:MAG TPA: hypothetical protein DCX27_21170 [Balneola sp.]|nr:hypothetical protein [Balneola sp.]